MLFPMIRSDFSLASGYEYHKQALLSVPLTVLAGRQDYTDIEEVEFWAKETTGEVDIHYFDGGHFFVNDYRSEVLDRIKKTLIAY